MITIKGKKISDFLIQTEKVTYPMEDNNFLRFIPLYEEYYFLIEKISDTKWKLINFLKTPNT